MAKVLSSFLQTAVFSSILLINFPLSVLAEDVAGDSGSDSASKNASDEPEKLEKGPISSFGNYKKNANVDLTEQPELKGENEEDGQSVVSGSVSKIKRGRCAAVITNNSEKSAYSVRFQVLGHNESGVKVLSKNFSGRVAPGEQLSRELSCREGLNMQLVIISGRRS